MSNLLVGIDLGTTFSAIARLDDSGRPVMIPNANGNNITPSLVEFKEDEEKIYVGESSDQYGTKLCPNVFGRFKRKIGTQEPYSEKHNENYEISRKHDPTTLSCHVLKKLKEDAEKSIGSPISEAVVTIPANFANEAREATIEAARLAGLKIKNIINEPTAAAIYYAFSSPEVLDGIYAIYDLGGGTFDISIIKIKEADIEVIWSNGIHKLGGDDFDEKIVELVRKKFKEKTGNELEQEDFTKQDAEEYKKNLTDRDKTTVRIAAAREAIELTRVEFEEAISGLIYQAETICEGILDVLDEKGLSPADVKGVILVGGSTRIPCVIDSVEKVFKQKPQTFGNPDEAVALGAALYVAYKADSSKLNPHQRQAISKMEFQEVANHYFGTTAVRKNEHSGVDEVYNDILIAKGTKIPCSETKVYGTISDNQKFINCIVTQSGSPEENLQFVSEIEKENLELPEPGRPAGRKIEVTFAYNENQTIHCSFVDVASGIRKEFIINTSGKQDEDQATDTDTDSVEEFKVE